MSKYKILSDSSCDLLWESLAENYQIPFVVSFDYENYYKEKEEISVADFYSKLDGVYPKTSVPSVQDFIDKFRPILENEEDIICLTISSHLSSSLQSAQNAKNILLEEFTNRKIHVEDSMLATVPQGLLVMQMQKMNEENKNFDDVVTYIQNAKLESGVNFTVGDVSYLQKGGRLGNVVLKSAKALNLKPITCLENGKVSSKGVARGEKSAFEKLIETTKVYFSDKDINSYVFCVGFTDENTKTLAENLQKELEEMFLNIEFVTKVQIGATIGAHTGKGTFGIAYAKKALL